ncbi:hypothetical protein QVZ41_08260 [Wenyingzhuangia sp. chi5]|uniref:Uncharacterized protein n=1 Tax=Wenyingzhuangia gilva TaxID=3057677 RepID=A0ABT8VS80_9FLAO|nr:hypothetical protein [Wenyingzhuangia sp. chi5]MDO3694834.1 hypothetical protein [Wenyingzhuangia sp. chi5]
MELDYIENVNEFDEHVVRLYNFNQVEAILFRDLILEVINNNLKLNLEKLNFIKTRNCNLILGLLDSDEGIFTKDNETFFCALTKDGYQNIVKLLEPYCTQEKKNHQYLYDLDNNINLLFAPEGTW